MRKKEIKKYFDNFKKFTVLFADTDHVKKYYTDKLDIIDHMDKIKFAFKLENLDEKFNELLYDMKSVVVSNEGVKNLVSEYENFVDKYK